MNALNMSIETRELKLRVRRFEDPFLLMNNLYFRFKLVNAEFFAEKDGFLYTLN